MRLFIGIPMAEAVVNELASVRTQLERPGDGLRWFAPASWHVTLQFLGETSADQCQDLAKGLHTIVSPLVPVKLEALGSRRNWSRFSGRLLTRPAAADSCRRRAPTGPT